MTVDKDLIAKKLDFLNQQLHGIDRMKFTKQNFVNNDDIHDLVVFRLQQAVETVIDIATHIIAESNLPRKETAKDALLLLGKKRIISEDLSLKMAKAADFRNRVVHGYDDFDYSLLFNDIKGNVGDLREFGAQILKFINI